MVLANISLTKTNHVGGFSWENDIWWFYERASSINHQYVKRGYFFFELLYYLVLNVCFCLKKLKLLQMERQESMQG